MTKKTIILLLLGFAVPVTNIHRFLNSMPASPVSFPYVKVTTDIQWYILDISTMLSFVFILGAFLLYVLSDLYRDRDCKILILTVLAVQLIDIVHYVLWFKQSEMVLLFESIILIFGTTLMLLRNGKKTKALRDYYYNRIRDFIN